MISYYATGHNENYENLSLKTDSDEDEEFDQNLLMRGSIDILAKFWGIYLR